MAEWLRRWTWNGIFPRRFEPYSQRNDNLDCTAPALVKQSGLLSKYSNLINMRRKTSLPWNFNTYAGPVAPPRLRSEIVWGQKKTQMAAIFLQRFEPCSQAYCGIAPWSDVPVDVCYQNVGNFFQLYCYMSIGSAVVSIALITGLGELWWPSG